MRRKLGVLVTLVWLAFAGIVVTASPAGGAGDTGTATADGERRNVGGAVPSDGTCEKPGKGERRNVGGTGPADGQCPPGQVKDKKQKKDKKDKG